MSSPTPIALPPHLFMPPDGIAFDYANYVALPAIASTQAVVQFTVPEGLNCVIKKIGNVFVGSGWTEGSGSLVWQIRANNGVIRNYDNIVASLGSVNNPSEIAGILVFEQQIVTLQVNNVSLVAGGALAGGRLSGWLFSKNLMDDPATWGM